MLKPDLILHNANVITLDPARPRAEQVAVGGGVITAVSDQGPSRHSRSPRTRFIDCRGRTLLPGFIDPHCHLWSTAALMTGLDLSPRAKVFSLNDLQSRLRSLARSVEPGSWIRGLGYDEYYLSEKRHPNRWDLDEAAPLHPVKLTHRSGHVQVLNSLALQQAGITRSTPEPPGGLMDRCLETGEPNGIFFEMSSFLAQRIPPRDPGETTRGLELANQEWLSQGVTTIHEASAQNGPAQWSALGALKLEGRFLPRVRMMIGSAGLADLRKSAYSSGIGPDQLGLGPVKIILNETTGRLYPPQDELNRLVLKIHEQGFQAAIHAIEPPAIASACEAIEFALSRIPRADHRHRLEHCSVCPPALARRIAELGIMVVTQPSFLYHSGDRYLDTVSREQLEHLYPLATLVRNRVVVAASSDSPVAPSSPLNGIYSAVTRRTQQGRVIGPAERLPRPEALGLYAGNAARACFEEDRKGSISPGKLADLVLLDGDPARLPPEEIKEITVEMTLVDGRVAWCRDRGRWE